MTNIIAGYLSFAGLCFGLSALFVLTIAHSILSAKTPRLLVDILRGVFLGAMRLVFCSLLGIAMGIAFGIIADYFDLLTTNTCLIAITLASIIASFYIRSAYGKYKTSINVT